MFNKKNHSLSKMNEDNDYGQFTVIDIDDNNNNSQYMIKMNFKKNHSAKYNNDLENNIHDDDDDSNKYNFEKNYFENTIYSATVILVLFMFIYFC